MKKTIYLILFFISQFSFAQNLVTNPSFEDTLACPDSLNQVFKAAGWYSVCPSPDYFNTCAPQSTSSWTGISVPLNFYGEQYPASGNAYAGFVSYGTGNHREGIGTSLISPLKIDTTYYASFKVCLALDNIGVMCAVNKIGLLFTTQSYSENNPAPICNCSQIYADSIISDTTNWTRVTGSFIADSAYTYLNIGNFFADSLTDSVLIHGVSCFSYAYFDDICVSTDSIFAYNYNYTAIDKFQIENLFEISPNPFTSSLSITLQKQNINQATISIKNILGQTVFRQDRKTPFSTGEGMRLDLSFLEKGIYLVEVVVDPEKNGTGGERMVRKVVKE
jgi:hypothetical protein